MKIKLIPSTGAALALLPILNPPLPCPLPTRNDGLRPVNYQLWSLTLLTVALLAAPWHHARAADRYYVGPNGGLWTDTANWSDTPGGAGGFPVPAPGDNVFIQPSSSLSVTLDTDVGGGGLNDLTLGATGGANAQFFHNTNLLSISERLAIGDVSGSQAAYFLNGGTLELNGNDFAGPLLVGQAGTGTLSISAGATVTSAGNVEVGYVGTGTVN